MLGILLTDCLTFVFYPGFDVHFNYFLLIIKVILIVRVPHATVIIPAIATISLLINRVLFVLAVGCLNIRIYLTLYRRLIGGSKEEGE